MFKTEPTYYQKQIYDRSADMPYAALFLEQGLGKSKIEIDTTCKLYTEGKLDGMIVISNKAVAENWYLSEIPKHIWAGIGYVSVLWGRTNKSESDLIRLLNQRGVLRIFSINVEALRSDRVHSTVSRLLATGRFKIVVDESTIIKNVTALQTRRVLSLGKLAAYTRILSGEPAPNGPIDFYSQYKFLSAEVLPGFTKGKFEAAFCELETKWFGARRITQAGKNFTANGQALFERMVGHCTFRLKKSEVTTKFPDIENRQIGIQMTDDQRRLYDQILVNVKTELSDILGATGTIRADVIVARLIKLHQVTSGFVTLEDGTQHHFNENPKLNWLVNYLEEQGSRLPGIPKPVIIWCHYRADVDAVTAKLQALFPGQVGRIYGGISDQERLTNLERFMSRQVPILVANPQSLGWGLTLTAADTAIYYSNHYNYEYRVQSRDRIHRLGQQSDTVTYIDLVMKDSIDEAILAALEQKKGFCKSLFQSEWVQRVLGISIEPGQVVQDVSEDLEEAA